MNSDLFEKLAAIEHERWADWQQYLHNRCTKGLDGALTIPATLVNQWKEQIATPYEHLSERAKDSDRAQVRRYWHLINKETV